GVERPAGRNASAGTNCTAGMSTAPLRDWRRNSTLPHQVPMLVSSQPSSIPGTNVAGPAAGAARERPQQAHLDRARRVDRPPPAPVPPILEHRFEDRAMSC